jgi:nucleoid-associated protein YgaU
MDRGVRIAAAASVLLGGILLAMLFRHPAPPGSEGSGRDERLVLRQGGEFKAADGRTAHSAERVDAAGAFSGSPAGGRPPTVVKPRPANENPPELARDFPGASAPVTADWNPAVGSKADDGGSEAQTARTHKVVDGDTLTALARRYLGSADRAAEIYELNRSALPRPEVLPIGVVLRIPPRPSAQPAPPNYMPQRPAG